MRHSLQRGSPTALLLGLAGLGAAGLLVLAASGAVPRAGAAPAQAGRRPDISPAPELALAPRPVPRESVQPALGRAPRDEDPGRLVRASPGPARKEREFLQAFLALARSEPGALEARAQGLLDAAGPAPEKVALLRALVQSGSPECTRWHAHAVRSCPDALGPHAVSVASYALGVLARRAEREPDAREALLRLSFERTRAAELRPELRRGAATAVARSGDPRELELLRRALLREADERLVLGVLAALEPRAEVPEARRILASFAREARVAPAAEE